MSFLTKIKFAVLSLLTSQAALAGGIVGPAPACDKGSFPIAESQLMQVSEVTSIEVVNETPFYLELTPLMNGCRSLRMKATVLTESLQPAFNNPQATNEQRALPWVIFSLKVKAYGLDADGELVETESLRNVDDMTEITLGSIQLSDEIKTLVVKIEGFAPVTVQIN